MTSKSQKTFCILTNKKYAKMTRSNFNTRPDNTVNTTKQSFSCCNFCLLLLFSTPTPKILLKFKIGICLIGYTRKNKNTSVTSWETLEWTQTRRKPKNELNIKRKTWRKKLWLRFPKNQMSPLGPHTKKCGEKLRQRTHVTKCGLTNEETDASFLFSLSVVSSSLSAGFFLQKAVNWVGLTHCQGWVHTGLFKFVMKTQNLFGR